MRVLIGRAELERRVAELAAEISRDYATVTVAGGTGAAAAPGAMLELAPPLEPTAPAERGESAAPGAARARPTGDPLIAVGVLKGSVFFATDLLKQVTVPVAVDFFQATSYGSGGASRSEVRIRKDIDLSIRGRDVLLIEDIVDTGFTVRTILDLLRFRGARSVRLCALLDKVEARLIEVPVDYRGFAIENSFVVGYGLDFDERFRNLPYVAVWEPETLPGLPNPS